MSKAHRFTLQIGHRDWEGHRPASAKMLQRLSTGERSIALHLPMLAGLAQGPGFPNLSCLGLLSDRVLRRYVPLPAAALEFAERSQRV